MPSEIILIFVSWLLKRSVPRLFIVVPEQSFWEGSSDYNDFVVVCCQFVVVWLPGFA